MDLRGLAALSSRILSLLSDAENLEQDGFELFGVSRICDKRGERTRARKLYEKSIAGRFTKRNRPCSPAVAGKTSQAGWRFRTRVWPLEQCTGKFTARL